MNSRTTCPGRIAVAALGFGLAACGGRMAPGADGQSAPASAPLRRAPPAALADVARLERDIVTLADDKWEGRATCTPGNDSAAQFIARRFAGLRMAPAGSVDSAAGYASFMHRFIARPADAVKNGLPAQCGSQNVAAIVQGSDPVLRNEYVVIGAHYDHLGRGSFHTLDPELGDAIHEGADDNASGTAGVLELARLFMGQPSKRSLLFVAFSGEEWGTLGSERFAAEALPRGRVQAMVNFDMIGRLRHDSIEVIGTGTAVELPAILRAANAPEPLRLGFNPSGYGMSDQASFYAHNIPVLLFFTGTHADHRRVSDKPGKIDVPGEAHVLNFAARVIRDLANRPELTFVLQAKPAPSGH